MRYQGGKSRIAKEIAEIINAEVKDRPFVSLFCGGCAVEERICGAATVLCNDAQPYLIAMWKALQHGWEPPAEVSETEYARIKHEKDTDPALTGFVGFGCSFGGKWFGGYARYQEHNYADTSRRSVLRAIERLSEAAFLNADYRSVEIPDNPVVYCDPPYADTLGYSTGAFDSEAFWTYIYELSARVTVFVSEETAPDWASCVWSKEFTRTLDVNKANQPTKVEKLFRIDRRNQKGVKISCDVETFSDVDLKTHGMYKYVESPNFELLLLAYSVDGSPVEVIDLAQGEVVPTWLQDALFTPANTLSGWNVIFERTVLSKYFGREIPLTMCRDTMLSALYCGYPASLDAAGEAIGLPQDKRKLTTGKALIKLFCTPTKPTRTNGERTRTYPRNEPEKWNLFKEYNAQDVVTEMAIATALSAFPVPEEVQEQWVLDQIINQRGVGVDMKLVEGALKIGAETHDKLLAEAAEISGLNNPKSVQQLTKWLEKEIPDEMEGVNDLRKETVTDLLAAGVKSADAGRMLEIRQLLGKTSTKKYDSIARYAGADGRARGLFQFYGANRTGRWAGRGPQIQNLPRNYLETLDSARQLVLNSDTESVEMLYGNVPDTLSQLIRTAFIPSAGRQFIVTDFSAIEARVLAWLAGEQWVLDVFATTGKIYEATASQMFGVPVEKIVHGNPEYELRQRGKVATLACIAEGELVTTDAGLVPIEKVTTDMRVWDGEKFAKHEGIVYNGVREVITYEGLTATPDHQVFLAESSEPAPFAYAAASRSRLLQSEPSRKRVRARSRVNGRTSLYSWMVRCVRTRAVSWLWRNQMVLPSESNERAVQRLSTMQPATPRADKAVQASYRCETKMLQPKRPRLSEIWRARYPFCMGERKRSLPLGVAEFGSARGRAGDRSYQQQWELRAGQSSFCDPAGEHSESGFQQAKRIFTGILALRREYGASQTRRRKDAFRDYCGGRTSGQRETQGVDTNRRTARVYDIRNAGNLHRYTVSGKVVHNCGYQGSAGAMARMDIQHKIDPAQYPELVAKWRAANPRIVQYWYDVERAALRALKTGLPSTVGCVTYRHENDGQRDFLTCELPSGRKLFYVAPFLTENRFGKEAIGYWGQDQTTKKWSQMETYGGHSTENICQSFARDCLMVAIQRLEAAGFPVVMHIHDEVVLDCPMDKTLDEANAIMGQPIPWAPGLLLKGAGFVGSYYKKD